jgi:hypothetical protein
MAAISAGSPATSATRWFQIVFRSPGFITRSRLPFCVYQKASQPVRRLAAGPGIRCPGKHAKSLAGGVLPPLAEMPPRV